VAEEGKREIEASKKFESVRVAEREKEGQRGAYIYMYI
jgi:hypothetical protein